MPFDKLAERTGVPVKMLIDGPSGSGKTFTALTIATGLVGPGKRIGLVDTQNGQSKRYAGRFVFYPELMGDHSPSAYVKAIKAAERTPEVDVLILDSATHEWAWCLDLKDTIEKNSGSSNNAWREITPQHKRFVEAIIQAKLHVIVTVKTKTEWVYVEESRGQRKIVVPHRIGTKPEQRDQFEYEFDLWLRMTREHSAYVEKSVFDFLETSTEIGPPGVELGQQLQAWFTGTTYDRAALIADQDKHERITAGSAPQPIRPAPIAEDVPSGGLPLPGQDDDEPEDDLDDQEDDDEGEDDAADDPTVETIEETRRDQLIARFRVMAAVAVMSKHPEGIKIAGTKLDELRDVEIGNRITDLERQYPNVPATGSYQCSVCGERIYPSRLLEHGGLSFPGLQIIALSVREFGRPLCAKDLARERTKARHRSPASTARSA